MTRPRSELAELMDRIADSLAANVLPHVNNHYARMQLRAACELVANLGDRVEWRRADLQARVDTLRAAVNSSALRAMGIRSCDAQPQSAGEIAELLERLTSAIRGLYSSDTPEDRRREALEALWCVIRADLEEEAKRIRTGMFS